MPLTFTLDDDDAVLLALALGFATTAAKTDFPNLYPQLIELTNRVHAGSSLFRRYKTPTDLVPSITCPRCGRTSFNPGDIANAYCGYCHDYHAAMRCGGPGDDV